MAHFISPHHKAIFGLTLAVLILGAATFWVGINSRGDNKKDAPASWITYSDELVSFKYPAIFGTTYIESLDWPPKVEILENGFSCTEAGEEDARAGKTEKRTIGNREFCVTTIVEGAAGSIYTQYAYATVVNEKFAILTFSTRSPQCANYDEAQKIECEAEKAVFNLDSIVNKIVNTLEIKKPSAVISNFKECEDAGYPVMESYPRQCRVPGGKLFVEEIDNVEETWGAIAGSVMLGPTCPVERDPPDPNCADRPYSEKFNVIKSASGQIVKTFTSDESGKFFVEVPPGEYIIRRASNINIFPHCGDSEVIKVAVKQETKVIINCDSGIR